MDIEWAYRIAIAVLLTACGFLAWRLRDAAQRRNAAEAKWEALQLKVNDLKLETLESRLDPHLFKNILNSIQSHAYQTYFALDKMAGVLDYILYESRNKLVSPKEEIEFALNLVEINKIKLSPLFELKVRTKIADADPLYLQSLMAPLISVDLIENAFKHADLQSPEAFISITIEFRDGTFFLTVANKISGGATLKKPRSGIGTATLEQRLAIIYRNHARLERFAEQGVYTAHLKINLTTYKDEMFAAG
jgi:sensor histidine kinase YesM